MNKANSYKVDSRQTCSFTSQQDAPSGWWSRIWKAVLDLSIYKKITMMLLICLSGYLIVGGYSLLLMKQTRDEMSALSEMETSFSEIRYILLKHIQGIHLASEKLMFSKEQNSIKKNAKLAIAHLDQMNDQLTRIVSVDSSPSYGFEDFLYLQRNHDAMLSAFVAAMRETMGSTKNALDSLTSCLIQADGEPSLCEDQQLSLTNDLVRLERIVGKLGVQIAIASGHRMNASIVKNERQSVRLAVVVLIVMIVLTVLSYLWGKLITVPLKHMAQRLREVRSSLGETSVVCNAITAVPVVGRDEIGEVAEATNALISQIRDLCIFRRTIEGDETTDDIYRRLADIFKNKLGLISFVIYEIEPDTQKMNVEYAWPKEIAEELPEPEFSERCRAVRTGTLVSSLDMPGICPLFPWPDALTHTCIPMNVGGEITGVVQFLFPFVDCAEREAKLKEALREANQYLMEALPVIKAKRLAQTLQGMATKDTLTGLYNRRYLEVYMDSLVSGVLRRGTLIGILMCDMDYFKTVNDEHGHDAGDAVLKQLGRIIKNNVRESDLVIRFGGEEFLVLLIDCEKGFSIKIAEKIRVAVEETSFRLQGLRIKKTISIGVSEFPEDTDAIWEAIKFADVALYKAKEQGRNKVVRFTPDMWQEEDY